MIGAVPNPKKSIVIDFPISRVSETILFIQNTKDKKYKLYNSNEVLKLYTFEALEFLSLGVYIDVHLSESTEDKTQIDIEVRRKVGAFDKSYEVSQANEHILKIFELISKCVQLTDEQIEKHQLKIENQPKKTQAKGCVGFLLIAIGSLLGLGSVLISCEKSDSAPLSVYIQSATASPTNSEQVVLKNNSGSTQNLSGWIIGDLNNPNAYSIPASNTIADGATLVFSASTMGFQINDSGETIYLKNSNGATVDTWSN